MIAGVDPEPDVIARPRPGIVRRRDAEARLGSDLADELAGSEPLPRPGKPSLNCVRVCRPWRVTCLAELSSKWSSDNRRPRFRHTHLDAAQRVRMEAVVENLGTELSRMLARDESVDLRVDSPYADPALGVRRSVRRADGCNCWSCGSWRTGTT
jgi:hypothetical protein